MKGRVLNPPFLYENRKSLEFIKGLEVLFTIISGVSSRQRKSAGEAEPFPLHSGEYIL